MPANTVLKRDWEKDHVYLIQFPRGRSIPSVSPFSLKLETWLRVADIPYSDFSKSHARIVVLDFYRISVETVYVPWEKLHYRTNKRLPVFPLKKEFRELNISNNFTKKSAKGQVPFIELNGRQIADSNMIIEHLIKHFNKEHMEGAVTPMDKAYARAFHDLVEHTLFWYLPWDRSHDLKWLASNDKGFGGHMGGVKKFMMEHIMIGKMQSGLQKTTQTVGIGRHSDDEVVEIAKKDLDALSMFLGSKKFFFGERASTFDCTVFGLVAEFIYTPLFKPEIKTHIEQNCSNLASHVNRMKETYWSDWDEACEKLSMETKPNKY